MAENEVEILIKARDDATQVLQRFGTQVGLTAGVVQQLVLLTIQLGRSLADALPAFADSVQQLQRMATQTGVTSENLQVMRDIVKDTGGNADDLTQALTFLNRRISEQDPLLADLNVTTRDTFTAFQQVADRIMHAADSADAAKIAFTLFGRGSADLLANVRELATGMDEARAHMQKTGELISPEMSDKALLLRDNLVKIGDAIEGLKNKILGFMAGPAAAFIGFLDKLSSGRPISAFATLLLSQVPGEPGPAAPPGPGPIAGPSLEQLARLRAFKELMAEIRLLQSAPLPGPRSPLQVRGGAGLPQQFPLFDAPAMQVSAFQAVLQQWRNAAAEITSSAGALQAGLDGVSSGLTTGFSRAFASIRTGAATLASVLRDIFGSLVDAILEQLARLAAAQAFQFLLGAVFGRTIPGLGSVGVGTAGGGPGGALVPGSSQRPAAGAAMGGTTINVYALDARDVLMQAANGSLRKAGNTVAFQTGY